MDTFIWVCNVQFNILRLTLIFWHNQIIINLALLKSRNRVKFDWNWIMSNIADPEELIIASSSKSKQVVFKATIFDQMLFEIILMENLLVFHFSVSRINNVEFTIITKEAEIFFDSKLEACPLFPFTQIFDDTRQMNGFEKFTILRENKDDILQVFLIDKDDVVFNKHSHGATIFGDSDIKVR